MNDFGVKNMDQVAPVSNSYRGTLKVSELSLNLNVFFKKKILENSISRIVKRCAGSQKTGFSPGLLIYRLCDSGLFA